MRFTQTIIESTPCYHASVWYFIMQILELESLIRKTINSSLFNLMHELCWIELEKFSEIVELKWVKIFFQWMELSCLALLHVITYKTFFSSMCTYQFLVKINSFSYNYIILTKTSLYFRNSAIAIGVYIYVRLTPIKCSRRVIQHVNGRIRLKYDHFRPENGDRVRQPVTCRNYTIFISYYWKCLKFIISYIM
jgi:hypothetical protein